MTGSSKFPVLWVAPGRDASAVFTKQEEEFLADHLDQVITLHKACPEAIDAYNNGDYDACFDLIALYLQNSDHTQVLMPADCMPPHLIAAYFGGDAHYFTCTSAAYAFLINNATELYWI